MTKALYDEETKTVIAVVPSCYDEPNPTNGGECYHPNCIHHAIDEPICCAEGETDEG